MEKITNEENDWVQMTNADVVLGPIQRVTHAEVINVVKKMKLGKATGPFCKINTQI